MEEATLSEWNSKESVNRIPVATYRLQFQPKFTFKQARDIIEYLSILGISDIYASPIFQARPESTHGYDICNFEEIDSRLGGVDEFDRFTSALRTQKMGLLLDIVPNHLAASPCNPYWMDVLRRGLNSKYAPFFDIEWNSELPNLR